MYLKIRFTTFKYNNHDSQLKRCLDKLVYREMKTKCRDVFCFLVLTIFNEGSYLTFKLIFHMSLNLV